MMTRWHPGPITCVQPEHLGAGKTETEPPLNISTDDLRTAYRVVKRCAEGRLLEGLDPLERVTLREAEKVLGLIIFRRQEMQCR